MPGANTDAKNKWCDAFFYEICSFTMLFTSYFDANKPVNHATNVFHHEI